MRAKINEYSLTSTPLDEAIGKCFKFGRHCSQLPSKRRQIKKLVSDNN